MTVWVAGSFPLFQLFSFENKKKKEGVDPRGKRHLIMLAPSEECLHGPAPSPLTLPAAPSPSTRGHDAQHTLCHPSQHTPLLAPLAYGSEYAGGRLAGRAGTVRYEVRPADLSSDYSQPTHQHRRHPHKFEHLHPAISNGQDTFSFLD